MWDAQRPAYAEHEAGRAENHPDCHSEDDTDRARAGDMVDEQPEHRAPDDRSDEHAAEAKKVTPAQRTVVVFVDHRVGPIWRG